MSHLISISNQQESLAKSKQQLGEETSTKNESERHRVEKRTSGFGSMNIDDGGTSDNSMKLKQNEGMQMFKISSKSQMRARANRASKKSNGLIIGTHGS